MQQRNCMDILSKSNRTIYLFSFFKGFRIIVIVCVSRKYANYNVSIDAMNNGGEMVEWNLQIYAH
jgi:hypothetical protein